MTYKGRPTAYIPRGKCREFRRKRFTFPRGSQGHRLYRPFSRHLSFPSPGKVPGFSAKTVHFPRGRPGYRLHRPLSPHLAFPPSGKVPGFSPISVHFPPRPAWAPAPQAPLAALSVSTLGESAGNFGENGSLSPGAVHFPRGWSLLRRSSRACLGKCLVYRHTEKGHLLDLG